MGEGESSPRFLKGLSANLSLGLDHSISPNQWITDPLSQSWVRSLIEWGNKLPTRSLCRSTENENRHLPAKGYSDETKALCFNSPDSFKLTRAECGFQPSQ